MVGDTKSSLTSMELPTNTVRSSGFSKKFVSNQKERCFDILLKRLISSSKNESIKRERVRHKMGRKNLSLDCFDSIERQILADYLSKNETSLL